MRRILIATLLAVSVLEVHAIGSVAPAKVIAVRVDSDGRGMVIFDKPIGGTPPSCVIATYTNALAFGGTGGKAVLAMALLAKASGTPLSVAYGTGLCSVYGGYVEDWQYGQ